MYRWNTLALAALALTLHVSAAKAETCHTAEQQDLLCLTPVNGAHPRSSEPPASGNNAPASSAEFWGSKTTASDATPGETQDQRLLPENAGITSHTDNWGKTTYYNMHGMAIGSSTKDIAGNVHYRDQNGTEVDRLW
ncbi:hypothetical protein GWD52_17425 [Enterobacteriaceae bacterium 4M9]|nr:hypothetical protein [Enterobacteriaceae bacterium 4M9]